MHTRSLVRLANLTAASTMFTLDVNTVRHLGKLVTHLKEFVLWILFQVDVADAQGDHYLWHDMFNPVFHTFNFRLQDGTSILADAPGQEVWVHNVFYQNAIQLDRPIVQNTTDEIGALKVHIPLTYFFDQIQYLVPWDDIQQFSFEITAGNVDAHVTVDSLDIRAFADVIYLDKIKRTPIRRSVRRIEAAGQLTIPKGRYHYGVIANDKGADANQFDSLMNLNLTDFDYSAVDGRVIAHDFHHEMQFERSTLTNAGAVNAGYQIYNYYADVMQPLWWPAGPRSCIPAHGPSGPGKWQALSANDPQTNTLFMLEILSKAQEAA